MPDPVAGPPPGAAAPLVRWTTVAVRTTPDRAELVADLLWGFGPPAVEERDGPEGRLVLAGFDDPGVAADAAVAVRGAALGSVRLVPVTDDGLDGWRAWARVERAGPFLLVPTWLETPTPGAGDHVLHLDPGSTFGSGSHPTTRLVLERLAALVTPGASVLDVGCGSGILAIGAALLGAGHVEAIDIDPAAPAVTAANAARNGAADRVTASTRPLAEVARAVGSGDAPGTGSGSGPAAGFDVVAANLLAPVVVDLAADLVAVVADQGRLVVSGLLADRWEPAVSALDGLEVVDVATAEGWAAVTLRRARRAS